MADIKLGDNLVEELAKIVDGGGRAGMAARPGGGGGCRECVGAYDHVDGQRGHAGSGIQHGVYGPKQAPGSACALLNRAACPGGDEIAVPPGVCHAGRLPHEATSQDPVREAQGLRHGYGSATGVARGR